ncbi:SrfA family protein [Halomonas vilamensis]|uniref:SrfA family protein n=1 Tax=Vreelandella vilamensis TaxID=531309 RepID=A0ABU1H9G7_9GAMM|nr:SrfA family protein [Halomonas vilamensis]MDR5900297.1 SrfA family protein [Halomonas vilamensis]
MPAILLHSGRTEHFRELGETGQPVYHSALQLRKVISRRLPGKERHLAIPQRDQQGEGIDWYSDISGDVVPWRSATEGEREDALIQLEAFKQDINDLASQENESGDHKVFTKLVKWVGHFPNENYVYLVDGTPVITFWGFIHPEADRHANPLLCLYPSAPLKPVQPIPTAPASADIAPASQTLPEPQPQPQPVATLAQPWWRRWWWLLPLLLLALVLLLFGLRACTPSNDLSLSTPSSQSLWNGQDIWPFNLWGASSSSSPSIPDAPSLALNGGVEMPSLGNGGLPEISMPNISGSNPEPALNATPTAPGLPSGMAPPEIPSNGPPATPSPGVPPIETSTNPPALEPLSLPADAKNGEAEFLNGNWRGAGVMDSQTGRPLQVAYAFDGGKGHMYIKRGGQNGMTCAGPVTAAMQDGQLQVKALEQARCEDGSHYEMPKVECRQANGEVASCAASYNDESFPMQLRKSS